MKYKFILFDWGDTLMKDFSNERPMVEWDHVAAVTGAKEVLNQVGQQAMLIVATSADVSDESQIRGALKRVGLDIYVQKIYCFKNTGLKKSPEFYRHILQDLGAEPKEAIMVGDSFTGDVLAANQAGMDAVWFNLQTSESRDAEKHSTIHNLHDLISLLED